MEAPFARGAFELWIESLGRRLLVQSLRGREALSRPYSFELELVTGRVVSVRERALVGRAATLAMCEDGAVVRRVRGIIASQESHGHPVGGDRHLLRVRLVPRLWLLRRKKHSRIFQDKSVEDIVSEVLRLSAVPHRWQLARRPPKLDYCVQYRESDFDFVTRLLAEAGIHYRFEHPPNALEEGLSQLPDAAGTIAGMAGVTLGGDEGLGLAGAAGPHTGEVLVLADRANTYLPLVLGPAVAGDALLADDLVAGGGDVAPAPLRFAREFDAAAQQDAEVLDFAYRNTIRTTAVETRGFDFLNPLAGHVARAAVDPGAAEAQGVTEAVLGEDLEVYEHHDEYGRTSVDRRGARLVLDQYQSRTLQARGESRVRQMLPGRRFELLEHAMEELNAQYVLTRVEHEAHVPELERAAEGGSELPPVYRNRFAAVPADVTFRPKRTPPALQQTLETAIVVGPAGEEVFTDEHGRVKVRFHWDRENPGDERASCWLRVAQSWTGAGWGTQHIPRVGTEVLVAFLEGDTDRPVVVGSLYNGTQRAPFELPQDKTRSGLRTRSSPESEGYNELSFEDATGAEEVRLRAQRDLNVRALHDHELEVGAELRTTVHGDEQRHVNGAQRESVHGAASLHVGGARTVRVEGGRAEMVLGDARTEVTGNAAATVSGNEEHKVMGTRQVTVAGAQVERVRGAYALSVGAGGAASGLAIHAQGEASVSSSTDLKLSADKSVVLTCGTSVLTIGPKSISINAESLAMQCGDVTLRMDEGKLRVDADQYVAMKAQEFQLKTDDAGVELTSEVHVQGTKILLNSPLEARDLVSEELRPPVKIRVVDASGRPVAGLFFQYIDQRTAAVTPGVTNADGSASVPADAADFMMFPALPPGGAVLASGVRSVQMGIAGATPPPGAAQPGAVVLARDDRPIAPRRRR